MFRRWMGRRWLAAACSWFTAAGALFVLSPRAQAADDPLAILIVPDDWRGPLLADRARSAADPWTDLDVDMRLIDPFPHARQDLDDPWSAREDLTDPWSGWPAVHYGQCASDCSVMLIPTGWDD